MAPLQEQIQAINQRLRAFGIEAVQEIRMTDREGKTIGQVKYGYRPQYVFDSVNDVLGPENWRYELTREEIFENQAVAEVRLFVRVDGDWCVFHDIRPVIPREGGHAFHVIPAACSSDSGQAVGAKRRGWLLGTSFLGVTSSWLSFSASILL